MSTATLWRIAEDLTNGNLTDAKRAAKRAKFVDLQTGFFIAVGWSKRKSTAAAIYLKNPGNETFQQYADAK